MATSKFLRTFRTVAGVPITTATIWLVPQANTYPTGALALTPHATRDGQYYRDNVPDGEYKMYIDPAGGSSPTLYEEEIWIGEARITTISNHFDSADSYKLKTTGIKDSAIAASHLASNAVETAKIKDLNVTAGKLAADAVETAKIKDLNVTNAKIANATILPAKLGQQTVTVVSTTNPTPSYIGQQGRDASGKTYVAIALTGTMWEVIQKAGEGITQNTDGSLSLNRYDGSVSMLNEQSKELVESQTNLVVGQGAGVFPAGWTPGSNLTWTYEDNNTGIISASDFPKKLKLSATLNTGNTWFVSTALFSAGMTSLVFGSWRNRTSLQALVTAMSAGQYIQWWGFSNSGYQDCTLTKEELQLILDKKLFSKSWTKATGVTFITEFKVIADVGDWIFFQFVFRNFGGTALSSFVIYELYTNCVASFYSNPQYYFNMIILRNATSVLPYVIYKDGLITSTNVLNVSYAQTKLAQIPLLEEAQTLSVGQSDLNNELAINRAGSYQNMIVGNDQEIQTMSINNCTKVSTLVDTDIIEPGFNVYSRTFTIGNTTGARFAYWTLTAIPSPTGCKFGFWVKKSHLEKVAAAGNDTDKFAAYIQFNTRVFTFDITRSKAADILANPFVYKYSASGYSITDITIDWSMQSLAEHNDYIYLLFDVVITSLLVTVTTAIAHLYWGGTAAFWNGYEFTIFNPSYFYSAKRVNPFILYPDNVGILKGNILSKEYFDYKESIYDALLVPSIKKKIVIIKSGNFVYVRSYFNETKDVVIQIEIETVQNLVVDFRNVYLISNTLENTIAVYQSGEVIHAGSDDQTPWSTTNCAYLGGGHGYLAPLLTVASHDKTSADIGSIWSDGTREWYLAEIVDSTHLWFAFKTTGVEGTWVYYSPVGASPLTHVSGATHTGNIAYSSQALTQAYPISKNISRSFLVDGLSALIDDEVTYAEKFIIVEEYAIIDPSTLTFVSPADWSNAQSWIKNKIHYHFQNFGALIVEHTSEILRDVNLSSMGFIQSQSLSKGTYDKKFAYMPKVLTLSGFDLKNIIDWTTWATVLTYTNTYVEDTSNPPDRFIQFLGDTDGTKRVGYAMGYNTLIGLGKASERSVNNTGSHWYIYSTSKSYPGALGVNTIVNSGTIYHCVAYRQFFDPQLNPETTAVYFHNYGSGYLLFIDIHQTINNLRIKLPENLVGLSITVVEKDADLSLITSEVVTSDGIIVSVVNGYGYAVLKLS